jgi:predicted flap endonuclease-1-like 5' DNA nuclease
VNVEALADLAAQVEIAIEPEPVAASVEPEPEPVLEAAPVELAPETVLEAEPAPVEIVPPAPDDLTRMNGIGPKLTEALAARGVTRFAQIAAWTADDLADVDKALSLKGRAVREAWVAQAKRFAQAS